MLKLGRILKEEEDMIIHFKNDWWSGIKDWLAGQRYRGARWSCGRALGFRSNGSGFETTSAVSKLWQFR